MEALVEGPCFEALCHEAMLEALSAREILRLRCTGKTLRQQGEAAASTVATARLEARSALTLGHPALAEYRSNLELLCVLERPPNLGSLMRHLPPISEYGDTDGYSYFQGLVEGLCRLGTTDYRLARHRAYSVENAIRFGDAAIIESVLSSLKDYEYDPNVAEPTGLTHDERFGMNRSRNMCSASHFSDFFNSFSPSVIEREERPTDGPLIRPERPMFCMRYLKKPEDFVTGEHVPSFLHNEHILFFFIRREQQQVALLGLRDEPSADFLMPRTPQPTVLKDTYPGWQRRYFKASDTNRVAGLSSRTLMSDFASGAIEAGRMDILQELYDLGAPMGDEDKVHYFEAIEACRMTGQSFQTDAKRTAWTIAINEIEERVRAAQP